MRLALSRAFGLPVNYPDAAVLCDRALRIVENIAYFSSERAANWKTFESDFDDEIRPRFNAPAQAHLGERRPVPGILHRGRGAHQDRLHDQPDQPAARDSQQFSGASRIARRRVGRLGCRGIASHAIRAPSATRRMVRGSSGHSGGDRAQEGPASPIGSVPGIGSYRTAGPCLSDAFARAVLA